MNSNIYGIDDVCNALKLKPPVLRKYSALLEDAGYTGIGRNSNNTRYYTDVNLRLLRELIAYKESGHMTLADAAKAIATRESGIDVMPANAPTYDVAVAQKDDVDKLTDAFLALTEHMKESDRRHGEQMKLVLNELQAVRDELSDMREKQAALISTNNELKEEAKERKRRSLMQKFFGVKE